MPTFRTWLNVRRRLIAPVALIVFVLLFLLLRPLVFRTAHFFQKPLVSSATWISNQSRSLFGSCSVKTSDYERVVSERNQFALDQVQIATLLKENELLKKELVFLKQRELVGIPGRIIGRTVSNQTSTFIVDVGSDQKVILGSAVIVGDGMFVGKVTRVDQTQSIITASTDFQLATGVSLLNKTRTIGIAQGTSNNLIELKFLPIDEEIHQNDIVVTSGLEDQIPSGLIVGIVNTVKPESEAPFQRAIVEPLSDVRRYDHVVILVPKI